MTTIERLRAKRYGLWYLYQFGFPKMTATYIENGIRYRETFRMFLGVCFDQERREI